MFKILQSDCRGQENLEFVMIAEAFSTLGTDNIAIHEIIDLLKVG